MILKPRYFPETTTIHYGRGKYWSLQFRKCNTRTWATPKDFMHKKKNKQPKMKMFNKNQIWRKNVYDLFHAYILFLLIFVSFQMIYWPRARAASAGEWEWHMKAAMTGWLKTGRQAMEPKRTKKLMFVT